LWLLDEPHAGLDAVNRDLLDGLIAEAVKRGATVLLASHEADRAVPLADRVVEVSGGATGAATISVAGSTGAATISVGGTTGAAADSAGEDPGLGTGGDRPDTRAPGPASRLVGMEAPVHVA
jgi:energy-coupling factor transporter ATP-binding protein EcfA2